MSMSPVLSALRKHKAGTALIALQIALTLAIVCNAIFIIAQRIERVNRPTGLDEANLILVDQQFVNVPVGADTASLDKLDSLQRQDLAVLRRIPGVATVTPVDTLPLASVMLYSGLSTTPQAHVKVQPSYKLASIYTVGKHGLATLGLKLVAGRHFRPSELQHGPMGFKVQTPVIMVTRPLARQLFPDGNALGNVVYMGNGKPSRIIGVLAKLQTQGTSTWTDAFAYNSVVLPYRADYSATSYAIRTHPGQLDAVMHAVRPALYKANPLRVIGDDGIRSFAQIRADAYKGDIGMAILMGIISIILIAVTGSGIVGLTSFWVGQRRKQIGVRRALGARKVDILRYFQIENLLIASGGCVLGIILAVGLNLVLMQHLAMPHLPIYIVLAGVVLVLLLGQAATLIPARRAAEVPPVVATRSV